MEGSVWRIDLAAKAMLYFSFFRDYFPFLFSFYFLFCSIHPGLEAYLIQAQ